MKHVFSNPQRESGYTIKSINIDYGWDDTFDQTIEVIDPSGDLVRFSVSCTDFFKELYTSHVDILG